MSDRLVNQHAMNSQTQGWTNIFVGGGVVNGGVCGGGGGGYSNIFDIYIGLADFLEVNMFYLNLFLKFSVKVTIFGGLVIFWLILFGGVTYIFDYFYRLFL